MKPTCHLLGMGALAALAAVAASAAALAQGAPGGERLPVQDPKVLMLRAIDAADGRARGVLVGDAAQVIAQRFQSPAPILIDVVTLRRFSQPGCRRLQVRFRQEDQGPRTLAFDINLCRDGQAPRSLE